MTRCFGYVRVSTARQGEGVSLAEQRDAIERYAHCHDLEIREWFEEKETAAKRGRPVFRSVLRRLRKGEADGLIVHKIDRSARNLRDWAELGEFMDEGKIHFAHESLDLNTRGGRLAADIQAVVAADYIRNLSDETRKGHLGRLKQGISPFAAPLGYLNSGRGRPKEIDPFRALLIREAFERYATGTYSLASLAEHLHERGLRTKGGGTVHKPYLARILRNPFYVGTIKVHTTGETFAGKHEPILSQELFDAVQARLDGKHVKKEKRHQHVYRQLFTCTHCERFLVGELQKGRVYYRCHGKGCPSRTVREDRIDAQVRPLLASIWLNEKELAYLHQQLSLERSSAAKNAEETIRALERELGSFKTRLATLTTAFADGDVDRETYLLTKESLLASKTRCGDQLSRLRENPGENYDRAQRTLELAATALQSFEQGNPPQKRGILEAVSSNRTLSGSELSVELAFPFSQMADSSCVQRLCIHQDTVRISAAPGKSRGRRKLTSILRLITKWVKEQQKAEKAKKPVDPVYQMVCRHKALRKAA